jgi:hypothetical protein
MTYQRHAAEYHAQLRTQLRLLRRSAEHYDQGDDAEALRIATVVRLLVHDTAHSTSLLEHLGVKGPLRFVDTAPRDPVGLPPGSISIHAGLAIMRATLRAGGRTRYVPPLGDLSPERRHSPTTFTDWWRRAFLTDNQGHSFARKDLVLALANKDGGAHVDSSLTPEYGALTREGSLGLELHAGGGVMHHFGEELVRANVRQVGWEVDETLRGQGPALGLDVD